MNLSARIFRTALVALAVSGSVNADPVTGSTCRDSTRVLDGEALQRFGIRLRATERSGGYRIDLKLQPSLCLRTSESDCGTSTYELASAQLKDRDERSPVALKHPNDYQYTSAFQINEDTFARATLNLIYRGGPCEGDRSRKQHTFIIDLSEVADTAGRHYF